MQSIVAPIFLHLQPPSAFFDPPDASARQAYDLPQHACLDLREVGCLDFRQ
jgi:hypothetical protein